MFDKLFHSKYTIQRYTEAPLLEERLKYLKFWAENGASRSTLCQISAYLLIIIDYLQLEKKKSISALAIARAAKKWGGRPESHPHAKHAYIKSAENTFINHATRWLKMLGYFKHRKQETNIFSNQIAQYAHYMQEERGLSEITISRRIDFAKKFLNYFTKISHSLHKLTPEIIDQFLAEKHKRDQCSRCSMHSYARLLRAFIKYAEQCEWCKKDLASTVKVPRLYKDESIPYSPTWDAVKELFKSTEGKEPKNIRDRAILMLLAIYGLRRSEVTQLQLDDIDWEKETIYLKRAKNAKPQQFPLCATVGKAILRYTKAIRPNHCLRREIFICLNAPYRPLSNTAISDMVYDRWKILNIKIKHYGAHSLRYACATHLINKGISLKAISDHLGHQAVNSTRIYAKVDLTRLRKVTDFNIGDLL